MQEIKSITLNLWKEEGKLAGKAEIADGSDKCTILPLDEKTAYLIVSALQCLIEFG